ncbi:glycosyltransferase family 9 protein [Ferrovum sp. PN-J185]|uniref:glycosyltransferase family 9 protein n=1 Tax=Ferrovum sp. PN-J185 TaxID=1356306 RepID=UPI00079763C1|nr:glycosyltransferase family 9 protein [Ferrovum sp. PN-J185]KXW55937.1 lipopolysaccharide core heptosyltransferase RfaQ [Ferrovum sp. PN-J185]MCC6068675.1 glycosyltransferase family 9 protein [Ferrovum sp. PN-J185]MDE1891922.1 glycosyltransferase family 9 protein [Betaproteobacteria bacterium]MDE2056997.1 glycosyltransferase family 9 protein [Betaproteobacteria bacterium]
MLKPTKKYLIICTLRLGDILLSTPIAHSIRQHDPHAQIDYLVLKGNEGILEGNSIINNVITSPHRTSLFNRIKEYFFLWNKYDVALSPVSSDRARWYCFISAKKSYGFYNEHTSKLSKHLLTDSILFDDLNTHTVIHGQKLLSFLTISPSNTVVPPFKELDLSKFNIHTPYFVIHPYPKFNYKMWDKAKWIELIKYIKQKSVEVILTGSSDKNELEYCHDIQQATGSLNLAGKLSLGEVGALIKKANCYIGPDTGITHIAAATGTKTVALFGPTNPVKWGPWPIGNFSGNPWVLKNNPLINNIIIVQGENGCVPCNKEGCENNLLSFSDCILNISVDHIKNLII